MKWFDLIWGGLCLFVAGVLFGDKGPGSVIAWWNVASGLALLGLASLHFRDKR